METAVVNFSQFERLGADDCQRRILAARERLGARAVILAHHYQRADVYRHGDLAGDSLRLSRLAAQTDAEIVVFCGVHFMAEVADILTDDNQIVVLPDLAAGCSMADMASLAKVERAWRELSEVLDPDETITPITYINSAADLKAFCARHGGIVCTSSNAGRTLEWAYGRRGKVLFFPDEHLGRWSARTLGIAPEEIAVWDFNREGGGLSPEEVRAAKILLWKGFCSVHQMFRPEHVRAFREKNPEGRVISHPECCWEVCELSDEVGSTERIIEIVRASPPGTQLAGGDGVEFGSALGGGDGAGGEGCEVHVAFGVHVLHDGADRPGAFGVVFGVLGGRRGCESNHRPPRRRRPGQNRPGANAVSELEISGQKSALVGG